MSITNFSIATWNVNSLKVRLPQVLQWLETNQPTVIALQEIKMVSEVFPVEAINAAGYQAVFSGQKTYNGVAVLSKLPLNEVITDIPHLDDPQRRILATSVGDIRIVNLYVPNGQTVDSDKYQYKLNWLEKMYRFLQAELARYPKLIVLGDFNIAPEDRDVHDPEEWRDQVLCSQPERQALQAWYDLGLSDTFRLFSQEAGHYSWWDYRAAGFRRNRGVRIDHILASEALTSQCQACTIDREPRTWERPSDHTIVCAQFADLG